MNTRFLQWTILLSAAALLIGCVPSLNPVYTQQDLIFDPEVVGVWTQGKEKEKSIWNFTSIDDKKYRLVYTDVDGKQGVFVAHLAEIDGLRFLDLYPENIESDTSGFYKFHLVPIHTIYLVKNAGPSLELAAIDYRWLDKLLTDNPETIQFATFQNRKLITAPTKDVQEFVLRHKDKFTADFQLERTSEKLN